MTRIGPTEKLKIVVKISRWFLAILKNYHLQDPFSGPRQRFLPPLQLQVNFPRFFGENTIFADFGFSPKWAVSPVVEGDGKKFYIQ